LDTSGPLACLKFAGDGWYNSAGRFMAKASCGRCSLNMRRHSSKLACRSSPRSSRSTSRWKRSCAPLSCGQPGRPRSKSIPKATHRREFAQSQHTCAAGEGHAVVTANGFRNSLALKEPLKASPHRSGSSIFHSSQIQHVASAFIAHRQRLTALTVGSVPPPFEIHCPNLVGSTGFAPEQIARPRYGTSPPLLHQPGSFQYRLKLLSLGTWPWSRW